ncbi:hypothetical protein BDR26DRAFT_891444 [Obelidium mucronatum]|nr:hypothetical protein BDR26DRAFT_891444 [Obelidium mucronatum]
MAFSGFREYMHVKLDKQQNQNKEYGAGVESTVLASIVLWFDGYLGSEYSLLDMKTLCIKHGAIVSDILTTRCTHIIAVSLTDRKVTNQSCTDYLLTQFACSIESNTKIELWKNRRIVQPDWILESIKQKKLLPWYKFGIIQKSNVSLFGSVNSVLPPSNSGNGSSSGTQTPSSSKLPIHDIAFQVPQEVKNYLKTTTLESNPNSTELSSMTSETAPTSPTVPTPRHKTQLNRESTEFAVKNSATATGFLSKYYQSSRLSKISNWKSDLRDYVMQLQHEMKQAEKNGKIVSGIGTAKLKLNSNKSGESNSNLKTIMHIDMDCFFASVALISRPEYKSKPIVICHSKGTGGSFDAPNQTESNNNSTNNNNKPNSYSTSEIASCNYVSRKYGIRNGMLLGRAQQLLAQNADAKANGHTVLLSLPYEFERYDEISKTLYKILCECCDDIMVVSCDEAYIDVSKQVHQRGLGVEMEIARNIRERIFKETGGCCASIGIGENMVVARVATKKAKPDGICLLVDQEAMKKEFLNLNVDDLPGVGYVMTKQMDEMGIKTCGDLELLSLGECIDNRPLENKARQSVGAEVNWGVRFQTMDEAHVFLRELSQEVYQRMEKTGVQGRHMTMKVKKKLYDGEPTKFLGCGHCQDMSKSKTVEVPFRDEDGLFKEALGLFKELGVSATDLRGVGIHVSKLVNKSAAMKGQILLNFGAAKQSKPEDAGFAREDSTSIQQSPKRRRLVEPEAASWFPSASQIDWSIVDNLPEEIRAEIMAMNKPPITDPIRPRPDQAAPSLQPPPPRHQQKPEMKVQNVAHPPTLLGRHSFGDVRKVLQDWVDSSAEPMKRDTSRVKIVGKREMSELVGLSGQLC